MSLPKLLGFNLYSSSYVFLLQHHHFCGVTTKVLHILLPIPYFMLKQSKLNSTFILFVIKSFKTNLVFGIFSLSTKSLISSLNISQALRFFSFRTKLFIVLKPLFPNLRACGGMIGHNCTSNRRLLQQQNSTEPRSLKNYATS